MVEHHYDCVAYRHLLFHDDSSPAEKQKEIKKFREGLAKGDNVITAGGIYGKIKEISDTYIILSIADGVTIKIDKGSVYPSAADAQQESEAKKNA